MRGFICILLISVGLSYSLHAQDINIPDSVNLIDEVFIYAPRNLNETGAKIIRFDSIVLIDKAGSDLSALLSENSPVFVKSIGRGSLATASFRGTNASHTKVLWNNIPLNSPMLGTVDLSLIPVNVADEISLYFGVASLQKSGGAIGGLVNLSTTPDWTQKKSIGINLSAGSYSTYSNSANLSFGNNKIRSVTRIYHNSSANDFEFVNSDIIDGSIQKQQNADYLQYGFLQDLHFRTGKKSVASIKSWYQKMERGIPVLTTNESGFSNNISRQNDENLILSAEYSYFNSGRRLDISSGYNRQNLAYLHKNHINGVGFHRIIDSQSKAMSLYNRIAYNHRVFDILEVNYEAAYNFHNVVSHENVHGNAYDTIRHEILASASVYSNLTDNLRIGLIARQERYDGKFSGFVPSFLIEYRLRKNLYLKSSIARNNRYPDLNDLYFTPGGNPDLVHEQGWQFESGIDYNYGSKSLVLQSGLSLFYSRIHNWILWRPTVMGYWQPDNIELVEAKGFEVNANIKYSFSDYLFSANGNYAYTSSINKSMPFGPNDNSVGKQLPYIPLHSANLLVRLDYRKIFISYQWNYYSERFTGSAAEPGVLLSIYPYYMNNASVGYNFKIKNNTLSLTLSVYNLFNEKYRSVLWQPMPGRNYLIKVIWRV